MTRKIAVYVASAIVTAGCLAYLGSRVAAQPYGPGTQLAASLTHVPPSRVVARVNHQNITTVDVALREAFRSFGFAINGQQASPETKSAAVLAIAHTFALVQAATAAGIHVPTSVATQFARQQWDVIQSTKQLKTEAQDFNQVLSGMGLTQAQYLLRYSVPAAKEMLTIQAMTQRIARSVPQGHMTASQWRTAQYKAIAGWEQSVYVKMHLVILQPGY